MGLVKVRVINTTMPTVPAITPQIEGKVADYFVKHPDQKEVFERDYGADMGRWLEAFTGWWDQNGGAVSDLGPYADEIGLLGDLGFGTNAQATAGGPNDTPVEQGLYNTVIPRLVNDATAGDAARRTAADALAQQAIGGGQAASQILARTQGGGFDSQTYLTNYPQVAGLFQSLNDGATPGTKSVPTPSGPKDMTAQQFAEFHYLNFGQKEGLKPAYIQSSQLAQDFANADRTTQANIAAGDQAFKTNVAAMQQAAGVMQQNLTGNLADRAAALQQQLATLNQNLDTLDATQRKALADSIAAQQANLEQSIATQRQALQDQIAAMGAAVGTEAQAKRAALTEELAGLTAAQAPVAAARTQAAELQATAVNVGLERTKDQLTADQAREGYVGGSTIGDAALARATVDARQKAAEAIGAANYANAADTRDIGVHGATGQRTIADALAEANRGIATGGAQGNFALTAGGATERRRIGDVGATGTQAIANNTGLSRAGIGAQGANQTFQDKVFGADQKRSLADALAQGTYGLTAANTGNTLAATTAGNAAKATYSDNDYNRSLGAAYGLTQIPANLTNTLTGLDTYANSGLNRTLNTLNWWATPTGTPPTPGAVVVTAPTTGNDLSKLGAGVTGAAFDWWKASQKPKVTTGTTSTTPAQGFIDYGG